MKSVLVITAFWVSVLTAAPASAQVGLSPIRGVEPDQDPVRFRAELDPAEAPRGGLVELRVTATLAPDHHVYSITQGPGGPVATSIQIDPASEFSIEQPFEPDREPEVAPEPLFDNLPVEKHHGSVTWTAVLRVPDDAGPGPLPVRGTIRYMVCNPTVCWPPKSEAFEAVLSVTRDRLAGAPEEIGENSGSGVYEHRAARFRVFAEPGTARPGDTVTLSVEAEIESPYHIYSVTQPWSPEEPGALPTSIEVSRQGQLEPLDAGFKGPPPTKKEIAGLPAQYHDGRVTWSRRFRIPEDASPGAQPIEGAVGYMICTDVACDPPAGFEFRGGVNIADPVDGNPSHFQLARVSNPGEVMQLVERVASRRAMEPVGGTIDVISAQTSVSSLPAAVGLGFLAGLILNVMPCVLPVISLKVYGFVKQAGEDPHRVRLLGLAFGAGILFVFLILAALAAFAGLGWGQQFQSDRFLVAMIALLVVFALGMFDVYAIRLPGFVTSAQATTQREGLSGSFAKGMLATVLATPCSGPFLGATLTYALTQPPLWIFTIFVSIGFGMASPYIVLALNPNWLKVLPRPGEWMNTFKEAMGFLLLGTAVWLLWQRRSDGEFVIWTVAFCTFTALAAWLYGRWSVPQATRAKRLAAPWVAGSIVVLAAFFCYGDLAQAPAGHWEPYSRQRLVELQEESKTVIVDWTADW